MRLLARGVALFVTALFTSQPVFFGHAFINQKDTPLMAFFLASVELGWAAVESRVSVGRRQPSDEERRPAGMVGEWKRLPLARRIGIVLLDLW